MTLVYIHHNFNPRSLAGATSMRLYKKHVRAISIHAPSRERLLVSKHTNEVLKISIHAPSRERRKLYMLTNMSRVFQSTLPRGSDKSCISSSSVFCNFNPRSLAGATVGDLVIVYKQKISIHAPSRERRQRRQLSSNNFYFNPRSLAGATFPLG